MKKGFLCIIFLLLVPSLSAQEKDIWNQIPYLLKDTTFRQAVEPEEGKNELELLSSLYPDAKTWSERQNCMQDALRKALLLPNNKTMHIPQALYTIKYTADRYTIENVAIEVFPGLWATGNLYKPVKEGQEKYPLILSAQGHGPPEPSKSNARFSPGSQAMCLSLVKMGAIVFNYDMFGIGESGLHMGHAVHRTGLVQCLQIFTTIRLIDYLASLPEVDPDRIAMTGASDGGTQTFLATVIDERIKVSVPVVQVSCFFPGGCPCESGRPIHLLCDPVSNNAEITALAVPRPLLVVSDGEDWTRTVDKIEYPFIQRIYGLYGKENLVENVHLPDEGHNYGPNKRYAMYEFMAKHLGLDMTAIRGQNGKYAEPIDDVLSWEQLLVFPDKKLPDGYLSDPESLAKTYRSLYFHTD